MVLMPVGFWLRLAAASARLLMLDYDGTLAPLTEDRMQALPHPDVREHLHRIVQCGARFTRVVILSGRCAEEVAQLLGQLPVMVVGEHGWEVRDAEGRLKQWPLPEALERALEQAASIAITRGAHDLERKRCSIVWHMRGIPAEEVAVCTREIVPLWQSLANARGMQVTHINGGIELRARGRDKGSVVAELLARCPATTFAVFVGDDQTDEDAFRAIARNGVGIRVVNEPRSTLATGSLGPGADVAAFLQAWLDVAIDNWGAA